MGLGLYERIGQMHNEITQVGLVCVYSYLYTCLAIVNSEMVKISAGAGARTASGTGAGAGAGPAGVRAISL